MYPSLKKNTLYPTKLKLQLAKQFLELKPNTPKLLLARCLGVSRSSLYYQSNSELKDLQHKTLIQNILLANNYQAFYGAKRISYYLRDFCNITLNHKRIARIKSKYNLITRRRQKNQFKRDINLPDVNTLGISNQIKHLTPLHPNHIWSSDFTYLSFHHKWIYVATIKDNYTKEILAWNCSSNHNLELVTNTYNQAIKTFGTPEYLHSDQGSEYRAMPYLQELSKAGIQISMSAKGCPYENGCQESYYNYFKLELGNINIYNTTQDLTNAIGSQIYNYNYNRIHSVIKTTPSRFRRSYQFTQQIN